MLSDLRAYAIQGHGPMFLLEVVGRKEHRVAIQFRRGITQDLLIWYGKEYDLQY